MRTVAATSRRSLLLGAGAGAVLLGADATATAAPADLSLDIPLTGSMLRARDGAVRTRVIDGVDFAMVGLTWLGPRPDGAWARTRSGRRWSAWQWMPPLDDLPDRGAEGLQLRATAPLWVRASDAVQVQMSGARRRDLNLALIQTEDLSLPASSRALARDSGDGAPRPQIRSRRAWGAKDAWRSGKPTYNRTLQQVHVHHTATSNDYSRADVPSILRAIYRYHAKNLGWSDIGYNFLIDRFGRIWQGRAGGSGRPVRGAHTLGFNSTSCGVAVIGNFDSAEPSPGVVKALAHLSAWKLAGYGREPGRRVKVYSHGSDRYPSGTSVRLPVIDGHRDTNKTDCPGSNLYAVLPDVRRRTRARMERFEPGNQVWTPAR